MKPETKKNLCVYWFAISSLCLLILFVYFTYEPVKVTIGMETLVIGTESGPHDLDPTDSWDKSSNDVIEQVVETLFTYDSRQYSIDETTPRINWLATGYSWDVTNTILTVDIRFGVEFHDGIIMDASVVAWNFNRFMYLMNHTGELPSNAATVKVHSLYEFPDGTPIFQSIVASDVDTVVFTLNAPYAPILDAMCYISCGILSPASTPATEIIDLTGDIVGTGPYIYDYYITDKEVRFTKFKDYWGAGVVEDEVTFDAMVYSVIQNTDSLNWAVIRGDVEAIFNPLPNYTSYFNTSPFVTYYEVDKPGLEYYFLSFNVKKINFTWRKAMSYAIDYNKIIEVLLKDRAFRAYSAISQGYGTAFDSSLTNPIGGAAYNNLTIARETILNGLSGDPLIDPRLQANDTINDPLWLRTKLIEFNYSYNIDNPFRSDLFFVLKDSFKNIGVNLTDGGTNWDYFIPRAYGYVPTGFDDLEIFFLKRNPDYLDPFNMLFPLYSNNSDSNTCQINDHQIMKWFNDVLVETNQTARYEIYHRIQSRIFTQLYCHAPLFHNKITYAHAADLYNVGYNCIGKWWALSVKRNLTWVPSL
ncbi:MAG: ABC transporter substrate-binding protein [Promethearchaeota archaeon]